MADPRELLRQLDAIEGGQTKVSARDLLKQLDEIEGKNASETVYVSEGGGRVARNADGGMSYSDDVWTTSDPAAIKRIMAGESPADVSMSGWDSDTISKAPVAARAQEFVRGFPGVGSYIDDAAGAIKGPAAKGNAQALHSAMERERPMQSLGLNLAGTVASAGTGGLALGPRVAAAMPASRAGQAGIGLLAGTAAGATEGAAYQFGDDKSVSEGAIYGGAIGGGLGLAAPYASSMLKSLVNWGKGTDTAVIASTLGVSSDAATVIRNAFRSGDMDAAKAALDQAGDGAMLADAGQAARELLDAAAASGGQAGTIAREAVEERASGTSARLNTALDNALGVPQGQRTAQKGIREASKTKRSALYDAAYSTPIDYASSSGRYLEKTLSRVPKSAIDKAERLRSIDGTSSKQILADVAEDGSVTFSTLPDVEQLHYILQGLDDAIEGSKGALGRNTPESTKLSNLRRQLANTVKKEVPAFKLAQDAAADTIRREKAIDTGYDLLKTGTRREAVNEAIKGASKAEKAAIKQGVRSYIEETLSNVSRTITDPNTDAREAMKLVRDLSSRANKTKLMRVLGKKEADKLFGALDKETIALELRAAIATNSKTAIRQSIQAGVKDQTQPGMVRTLMQGEPINATKTMVQALTGETAEAQQIRQMGLFEEVAGVLTQVRGKGAIRALKTIEKAIQGQPMSSAEAAQVAQVLTASGAITADRQASRALLE